ncbi:hypothetical protein [Micromonospora sp. CPCC 205556]|uniref:hypothetical protein n=1 Tax=Micromonospora sp. CPCC 205556 TaxID=3122398 RepID=UPI002FF154B3
MSRPHGRSIPVPRLLGAALALFGVFVLFGGLFVPLHVILREPAMVPAPESWVAGWLILLGLALAAWPRRDRPGT